MDTDLKAVHRDYSKELVALLEKAPEGYFDRLAETSLGKGAVASFLHCVGFLADASTTLEDKAFQLVDKWLSELTDIERGAAKVYTAKEWRNRGERYGKNSLATIVIDGSWLYDVFNAYDCSGFAQKAAMQFSDFLGLNGFYFEMGYAWSLHIYKI